MPRKDASAYRVVGVELTATEVAALELIADRDGVKRPDLIRTVLRNFIRSQPVKPTANPSINVEKFLADLDTPTREEFARLLGSKPLKGENE